MIVYIEEGDIFSFSTIKNYAHGCNCAGAMGKGIALAFKEKFPVPPDLQSGGTEYEDLQS